MHIDPQSNRTHTRPTMHTKTAVRRALCSLLLGAGVLSAPALSGAQVVIPTASQTQPVVLRGATIHTVTKGTIANGTIVLDRGKIIAIGDPKDVMANARVQEAYLGT